MRIPIQSKLFYSHFLAVILVSGSVGTLFYRTASNALLDGLQGRLKNSAGLISRTLDAARLEHITSAEAVADPVYLEQLGLLRELQDANQDIAFIYIMRLDGDQVSFVVDADTSEKQALPGTAYTAGVPNLRLGFSGLVADDEVLCDEWGCFLSGYAPLKNGAGRFLVGIDMRADEVQKKFAALRIVGLISLGLSLALAVVASKVLARRITRPLTQVIMRSTEIADGILGGQVAVATGDELEDLAGAFNKMSGRLAVSHAASREAMVALEEARDTLEERVRERTSRLEQVNHLLLSEVEERKRAEAELVTAASTDYLTGLLNRRAVFTLLEHERRRQARTPSPTSLVMVDLDHFKRVNDRWGHQVGDRVLVALADFLRSELRAQDAVARWGGEEFLILLPETDLDGAARVAEKIRRGFGDAPRVVDGTEVAVTLSIGAARLDPAQPVDESIRRADLALYRAKEEGRNRIVRADET